MTSRGERRAKTRKQKGGCGISVSIRGRHEIPPSPVLEYMAKASEKDRMEKVLRSKQVPGY